MMNCLISHLAYLAPTPDASTAAWTGILAIVTFVAAIAAILAAKFTWGTLKSQREQLKEQIAQSKMETWRSISDEFDHKLASRRATCGTGYGVNGNLSMLACQPIMDFFETLGYLVKNSLINEKLACHSFHYYFSGYFKTVEEVLRNERMSNEKFYEDVFFLHDKWGADPSLKSTEDLQEFFETEQARGQL